MSIRTEDVMLAVECHTGLSRNDLLRQDRHKPRARARFAAFLALYRHAGLSKLSVGHFFNRDRTTVIHGIKMAHKLIHEDEDFARLMARIDRGLTCLHPAPVDYACAPIYVPGIQVKSKHATRALHWQRNASLIAKTERRAKARSGKPKTRTCAVIECGKTFKPESPFQTRCPICRKHDMGMFEGYAA